MLLLSRPPFRTTSDSSGGLPAAPLELVGGPKLSLVRGDPKAPGFTRSALGVTERLHLHTVGVPGGAEDT